MSYIDLINNGLLDPNFPYPLAFETCYNLALELIDLFIKLINFGWGIVLLLLIVLVTRIIFRIMK